MDGKFRIDFVLIGAQKNGTTSMAGQLAAHTPVSFCSRKEPGFFNRYDAIGEALAAYHRL